MGVYVSDDVKRRILDTVDIADLVRSYGVELKRAGRSLKACCPFHNERTPSFNVNQDGQYFKCFGCGKGGDVFTFVMLAERVEFPEALRMLAERAGVAMEYDPTVAARSKRIKDWKGYLYKLNAVAADFYRERLFSREGQTAREYLNKRGISEESWERFGLGYAPATGSPLLSRLSSLKAPRNVLVRTGLVSEREGGSLRDYFFGRLMFPIRDAQGRTIAFGGRVLGEGEPKYLNTRETPLFSKSAVCYGLAEARDALVSTRRAILVEGYTDVVMCRQYGVENVVAALGTAITADHFRVLRRFVDEIILLTDEDEAGRAAGERSLGVLFQEDLPARVASLPGRAKDPCEFLLEAGREAFEEALAAGVEPFDYKFRRVAERLPLETVDGQARAAQEMLQLISLSPNPLRRAAYRRRLADLLDIPEKELHFSPSQGKTISRNGGDVFATGGTVEEKQAATEFVVPPPENAAAEAERELLRFLFHEPAWLETVLSETDLTAFVGRPERVLGTALLSAVDEGKLPPSPECLAKLLDDSEAPAAAAMVVRELASRLDSAVKSAGGVAGAEAAAAATARALSIALAEDGPERLLLKPEEDFDMRLRALRRSRVEYELSVARRTKTAAKQRGDPATVEQLDRREVALRRELRALNAAR